MADIVVAGPRRRTGQHREHRCGAVERLDLGFLVYAQHQRPLGWVQIQPDDMLTLSTNSGSVDNFQESCLCGANPNARQIRDTADCDNPSSAANDRVDQCVASAGRCLQGAGDHRLDLLVTDRARPPWAAARSTRPSRRSTTNRDRHLRALLT